MTDQDQAADACAICAAGDEVHGHVWHAYASRMSLPEAARMASRHLGSPVSEAETEDHLLRHHQVQPPPTGKFNRSLALQEALTTFPPYVFYLLRAIYRAKALSLRQIYAMFYLNHSEDSPQLRARMASDLARLSFRSFLYQHWPENKGALEFEDPGPYYFINRQAIPLVERFEETELEFERYVTSLSGIKEYYLEQDSRLVDVIVSLRQSLYRRVVHAAGRDMIAHLAIEHWHDPHSMAAHLHLPDGNEVNFAPSALLGLRVESRDQEIASLLPLWLEYDRGIQPADEVAEGVIFYGLYYASPEYQAKFPRLAEAKATGPLLLISDTPYRRDEVSRHLEAMLAGADVPVYQADRLSLLADPYADGVLTSPCRPGERFSLLDRVVAHGSELIDRKVFSASDRLTDPSAAQLIARGAGDGAPKRTAEQEKRTSVDMGAWQGKDPAPAAPRSPAPAPATRPGPAAGPGALKDRLASWKP